MSHVLLVGFMGAGKSTVGRLLADRLRRPFVDLDDVVADVDGRAIAEIFREDGEESFRAAETEALRSLAGREPSVVACGGGAVLDPGNRAEMGRLGCVVWLRVSAETALARAGGESGRPLLDGRGETEVAALVAAREEAYDDVAELSVDTEDMDAAAVADALVSALEGCLR